MTVSPETLKTIVMLAQSLVTFRAVQLAATTFHLDAICQHTVRVRFRKLIALSKTHTGYATCKYILPNGHLDGTYTILHDIGTCCQLAHYINDVRHGYNISWYRCGRLCGHTTYINNKLCGEYTIWYESGQVQARCYYRDNRLHGKYMAWCVNGQSHIMCEYVDGVIVEQYIQTSRIGAT